MTHQKPLCTLIFLVSSVFFLRKVDVSQKVSFIGFPRYLQNNDTTDNSTTLAEEVEQKLCSSYLYVPSTEEAKKDVEDVSESIRSLRSEDTLKKLIESGNTQTDLIEGYLHDFIPFLASLGVPLILSFIVFIFCTVNWCCMCCPSCSTLRCGICDRPNSKSSIKIYAVMSILFSLFVLGASLGSITVFNDISTKVDGTLCQTIFMLKELHDGNLDEHWFGVTRLKNLLWGLGDDLYATRRLFRQLRSNFTALENQSYQISDDLQNLGYDFANETLPRAYFIEEEQYNPRFTQTLGEQMSVAYDQINLFQVNLQGARTNFNITVEEFSTQRDQVINILDQGYLQTKGMENDIESTLKWLDDNGEFVQKLGRGFKKGLQAALGVLIGLSGFALLSVIVNLWSKFRYFNKCMHLSWFLMGLFAIVAWIASTILFPATVGCVEVCEVVDEMLNNETFANQSFNAFFGTKKSSLKDSIISCLHGSGEIIDNYNVKENLGLIDDLQEALNSSTDIIDRGRFPDAVDLSTLTNYLDAINNNEQLDDERTLIDLNLLTELSSSNSDGQRCADVRDFWVLNDLNCSKLNVTSILNSQEPDNFGVGVDFCIPLERWMEPSGRDISTRYTPQIYQNCDPVSFTRNNTSLPRQEFLDIMVNRFIDNRVQLKNLVDSIQVRANSIGLEAENLLSDAKESLKAPFTEVKNTVMTIIPKIFDQNDGLLYNTRCTFVEARIRSLSDELCVGLIPSIYHTSVALIIGSVMASILTLTLFFMLRKLLAKQSAYDTDRKTYPQ